MLSFIGRGTEDDELLALYKQKKANLVVVYGRRRVGKSTLIKNFLADKVALQFEGIENATTKEQLFQVGQDLAQQLNDPLLASVQFKDWNQVFDYLTRFIEQARKKVVIFMDEFQWLAAGQARLVSLLKKYWDNEWLPHKVMLVLCGSVSSYMVRRVIRSKALYGRIDLELCLKPFTLREMDELLAGKRSHDEVLHYALTIGGIPRYLQMINTRQSFEQNMNRLCFMATGALVDEYEKIFYSQFKEYRTYELIVNYLQDMPRTLAEVAARLKMASGGGVKLYLDNLEKAQLITSYVPYDKDANSKLKKYKLTDEYLRFFYKYMYPNLNLIKNNTKRNLFTQLVKPVWQSWLGYAFESFCLKNAVYLADIMGFGDQVLRFGPVFHKGDKGFQIDLLYLRLDKVITVCEIKFLQQPVTVAVVKDVEQKCQLIKVPRGYTVEKALISRFGVDETLQELGYFQHVLSAEDLF